MAKQREDGVCTAAAGMSMPTSLPSPTIAVGSRCSSCPVRPLFFSCRSRFPPLRGAECFPCWWACGGGGAARSADGSLWEKLGLPIPPPAPSHCPSHTHDRAPHCCQIAEISAKKLKYSGRKKIFTARNWSGTLAEKAKK